MVNQRRGDGGRCGAGSVHSRPAVFSFAIGAESESVVYGGGAQRLHG